MEWVVNASPRAALPPGKRPSTHCIGGSVGPRAGLDGCGKSRPQQDFYFVLCTLFVLRPGFAFRPSWNITYNTNIHAPGGIRTCNPSKRSAADSRLRPLGHWDRLGFDPRTVQPVASPYTD